MATHISRRRMLRLTAATIGGITALAGSAPAQTTSPPLARYQPSAGPQHTRRPPGEPGQDYTPVVTPNGATLPYKVVDGVKVFHLSPSRCEHEFAPGLVVDCWGYNGRTPGPTIEAVEGDRVRIYVTNSLPEPTTRPLARHPAAQRHGRRRRADAAADRARARRSRYEFTLRQHGTLMYHPHFDEMTQMALGMRAVHHSPPSPQAAARPGLRDDAQRVAHRPRHPPAEPQRNGGVQCLPHSRKWSTKFVEGLAKRS